MKGALLIILPLCIFLLIFVGYIIRSQLANNSISMSTSNHIASINNTLRLTIKSSVFDDNGFIPKIYTCEGNSINPPLSFLNIPKHTKSLALVVLDPDAPGGTWTHWILYNISPETTQIYQNSVPSGASQGITSGNKNGYEPPCPPSGTHRYIFTLYSLDLTLSLSKPTRFEIENAIKGHIIEKAILTGLYQKGK